MKKYYSCVYQYIGRPGNTELNKQQILEEYLQYAIDIKLIKNM